VQTVTAGVGIKPVRYTNDAADSAHPARTEEQYQPLIARTKRIRAIPMAVVWRCEEHALAGAAAVEDTSRRDAWCHPDRSSTNRRHTTLPRADAGRSFVAVNPTDEVKL
jgi:hypothetical protein